MNAEVKVFASLVAMLPGIILLLFTPYILIALIVLWLATICLTWGLIEIMIE